MISTSATSTTRRPAPPRSGRATRSSSPKKCSRFKEGRRQSERKEGSVPRVEPARRVGVLALHMTETVSVKNLSVCARVFLKESEKS